MYGYNMTRYGDSITPTWASPRVGVAAFSCNVHEKRGSGTSTPRGASKYSVRRSPRLMDDDSAKLEAVLCGTANANANANADTAVRQR